MSGGRQPSHFLCTSHTFTPASTTVVAKSFARARDAVSLASITMASSQQTRGHDPNTAKFHYQKVFNDAYMQAFRAFQQQQFGIRKGFFYGFMLFTFHFVIGSVFPPLSLPPLPMQTLSPDNSSELLNRSGNT
jgi:hypothetical protein